MAVRIFPNCFRCNRPFDLGPNEPQYTDCPSCREAIKTEATSQRIKEQVERMDWPNIIYDRLEP